MTMFPRGESDEHHLSSAHVLPSRAAFLDLVRSGDGRRLLEIGAGTGQDSLYFKENGLDVVAVDLVPPWWRGAVRRALRLLSWTFCTSTSRPSRSMRWTR
ncbi:class I SAM-dependent methyltransferase [Nonomuraea sp. NPDC049309]|uniref:class I SAM-dependent methyltransferase n=1 Tax=Nonomuraea sp. NPDC049309 TaxID=3364350 RepID=UPI00371989E1